MERIPPEVADLTGISDDWELLVAEESLRTGRPIVFCPEDRSPLAFSEIIASKRWYWCPSCQLWRAKVLLSKTGSERYEEYCYKRLDFHGGV